jgi:hypothetical protein
MFSPFKLLVLAAIVVAIWYGYKVFARRAGGGSGRLRRNRKSKDDGPAAVEMDKCSVCGIYITARDATACEEENCPYPG